MVTVKLKCERQDAIYIEMEIVLGTPHELLMEHGVNAYILSPCGQQSPPYYLTMAGGRIYKTGSLVNAMLVAEGLTAEDLAKVPNKNVAFAYFEQGETLRVMLTL